jgi:hypothetical protein
VSAVRKSAGTEHPDDLVQTGRRVVPVVEAEGRDDEVDGVVGERQRSDVADPEAQVRCAGGVSGRSGARDHLRGQVNAFNLNRGIGRGDEPGHSKS